MRQYHHEWDFHVQHRYELLRVFAHTDHNLRQCQCKLPVAAAELLLHALSDQQGFPLYGRQQSRELTIRRRARGRYEHIMDLYYDPGSGIGRVSYTCANTAGTSRRGLGLAGRPHSHAGAKTVYHPAYHCQYPTHCPV